MNRQPKPLSIGRYRILDTVGSGAMGTVYKAHDPSIGRDVAIKVVRIDVDGAQQRAEAIDRFRLEVQAAGRCSHPAIVGVFDFVDQAGDPAIVMELMEGASLHRVMREDPTRAASLAPEIPLQVLQGLGYAHDRGIIHRDIKPANILLTTSGQAKIADFGIARLTDHAATIGSAMIGTPSYMAPEQLAGDPVDRRADLFAVGAILYEMLTGRPPFAGHTVTETALRLSGPDPADMAPVLAGGGQRFIPLLQRALAKDRTRRFQTATLFAAALQAASPGRKASAVEDPAATIVMSPPSAPPASFEPDLLRRIEANLARFVGPMARRMVRQATQYAATPGDLYAALARELPDAADRSLFLRLVGGGRVEPSLGGNAQRSQTVAPRTTPPQTLASGTVGHAVISPAATAAAHAALVEHVGPIARILVRDAAAQATSDRDFIDRLCAHVPKPADRATLHRRLRADVKPG
jgi:serine/threonine-protein kinase